MDKAKGRDADGVLLQTARERNAGHMLVWTGVSDGGGGRE